MKTQTHSGKKKKRSLNGRILKNTTLNIIAVVVVCCVVMAFSMQSLAGSILLDSLQPMARQSAKTVEANIHMLADRMMTIAGDTRMYSTSGEELSETEAVQTNRETVLTEAAEIYELHTIALYDLEGRLLQAVGSAPDSLDSSFFSLLKETDNLTIHSSTIFQNKLGITMGMPVKKDGETGLYVVGVVPTGRERSLAIRISPWSLAKAHSHSCMTARPLPMQPAVKPEQKNFLPAAKPSWPPSPPSAAPSGV